MSENYIPIGNDFALQSGFAFPSSSFVDDGIPIVRMSDLKSGQIKFENTKYVHPSWLRISAAFALEEGDFLLGMSGSLSNHAVVSAEATPAFLNQRVGRLRIKTKKQNYGYACYWLKSDFYHKYADIQGEGAAQKNISAKQIELFTYRAASFSEQCKIVEGLKTIDQAIASTEALIEKYQHIKAGLMNDLFTRGIGADGKLRPPREQAPELYHKKTIGWIPKEWKFKRLDYGLSASPKNGFSPKEVDDWQGVYVLGLSCLTRSGFRPTQLKRAPKSVLFSNIAKLKDGDFLISRSNTQELVGLCGIYRDVGHRAIYPDLMMKLQFNQNLVSDFVEKYFLSPATRQRISAIAVGTSASMVKINATSLKSFKVVYPKADEQIKIVERLKPIERQISSLHVQSNNLKKQKSGLMHDLLTGKVTITPPPP